MKLRSLAVGILGLSLIIIAWEWTRSSMPATTRLSLCIGQTFLDVVHQSSYDVEATSNLPSEHSGFGATWVTEPAVIIEFTDPQSGFVLPPTTFAAVTYEHGKVQTISTSPMLKMLPFEDTVETLAQLQEQFKRGAWSPWTGNGSTWFDLSADGRAALRQRLSLPGWSQEQWLHVKGRYGMIFRIKCMTGCEAQNVHARYLIDIGVSDHDWDYR